MARTTMEYRQDGWERNPGVAEDLGEAGDKT